MALKISFDHWAGSRSGSASTCSPALAISAAAFCTTANGVSSYGPSHVSVSSTYSMCVSEWRVPLMNVTPEMIGHEPAERTASSAPRPFRTVMIVASGKRPRSDSTAPSRPAALVATMPRSNGAISPGSAEACTVAWRSLRPLMRRPSRRRAEA